MKTTLLIACLFVTHLLTGQFYQFWNSKQYYNPATTGNEFQHEVHLLNSFSAFADGTSNNHSILATYGTRLSKYKSGLGFLFNTSVQGFPNSFLAKIQYAYHATLFDDHHLSAGVGLGINRLDYSNMNFLIYQNHEFVPVTGGVGTTFRLDAGLHYNFNRLKTGISLLTLNQPTMRTGEYQYQEQSVLVGMTSYTFGEEKGFQFRPLFQYYRYSNFTTVDLTGMFIYKNTYMLGLSYRVRDGLGISAGYTFKDKFNLSYFYHSTFSKLNNSIGFGTHEIHLGMTLGKIEN